MTRCSSPFCRQRSRSNSPSSRVSWRRVAAFSTIGMRVGADPLPAGWGKEIAESQGLRADKAMIRAWRGLSRPWPRSFSPIRREQVYDFPDDITMRIFAPQFSQSPPSSILAIEQCCQTLPSRGSSMGFRRMYSRVLMPRKGRFSMYYCRQRHRGRECRHCVLRSILPGLRLC